MGTQLKVYELAKELGLDSISLLDKLKELGIIVKNHMSGLEDKEVLIIRQAFKKAPETKKASSKVRKKPVLDTEPTASDLKTKSTIIRKKPNVPEYPTPSRRTTATSELRSPTEEPGQTSDQHSKNSTESITLSHDTGSYTQASDAQPTESTMTITTQEEAFTPQGTEQPIENLTVKPPTPPKKPEIVLTPRPIAPRKSILKIVEATAPPPRPIIMPAATPGAIKTSKITPNAERTDGYRIIKMTKETLDELVQEEAARKKPGTKELEKATHDVRFADYRKKELVFLPNKKKIPAGKALQKTKKTVAKAQKRIVEMGDYIAITDFANQLSTKGVDIVKKLFQMGQITNINQSIDFETAVLIASEYHYEVRNTTFQEKHILENQNTSDKPSIDRPPIITIMGHVDHGKTTLLDAIRHTNVVATEAGGITQHIGAYTVDYQGKAVTFIDTPGHEAFTEMRARGANITDIVILVVSADDGVMPQTREAISHAQAAGVPIIVAVNKIDKPGANPEKIQQSLADLNLLAEEWGGETMYIRLSALQKINIDKLLEAVLLQAEILDLKAPVDTMTRGVVLESRIEKGRGAVSTVLIHEGTLKIGASIIAGIYSGKVRAMTNDQGQNIKVVTPGYAVEILGLDGSPQAGDMLDETQTEEDARKIIENRKLKKQQKTVEGTSRMSLDDLFLKIQSGDVKELSIIIKADAFGSVEVLRDSLIKLSTDKIKIKILLSAVGGITESDVLLASASGAIIVGFNVRPETKARQLAESERVEIKSYNIIYELIDDVKKAMIGLLEKKKVEHFLGRAEVRQVFNVPKVGTIAGAFIVDGKFIRGANVRLLRNSKIIFDGKLSSLKRFKEDAKEVAQGFECGISIERYGDLKIGDSIEAYQVEYFTPEL